MRPAAAFLSHFTRLALRRVLPAGAALALGALVWRGVALRRNPPLGHMEALSSGPMHVIEDGQPSGPAVLLIHGSDGVAQDWPTSPLWERLAASVRLLAPDRLGHGYTPAHGEISVEANARALAELLGKLELEQVTLLGHSYGAPVAIRLAELLGYGRVRGLVLVSPVGYSAPGLLHPLARMLGWRVLGGRPIEWLVTRILLVPVGLATVELEGGRAFSPAPLPHAWRQMMAAFSLRRTQVLALAEENRSIADELRHLQNSYGRLERPVIILTGHRDALTPPQYHAEPLARALPQAELWTLEGGHQLHWTHPTEVARAVQTIHTGRHIGQEVRP